MLGFAPDWLAEQALIEASRAQREALLSLIWRPKR